MRPTDDRSSNRAEVLAVEPSSAEPRFDLVPRRPSPTSTATTTCAAAADGLDPPTPPHDGPCREAAYGSPTADRRHRSRPLGSASHRPRMEPRSGGRPRFPLSARTGCRTRSWSPRRCRGGRYWRSSWTGAKRGNHGVSAAHEGRGAEGELKRRLTVAGAISSFVDRTITISVDHISNWASILTERASSRSFELSPSPRTSARTAFRSG